MNNKRILFLILIFLNPLAIQFSFGQELKKEYQEKVIVFVKSIQNKDFDKLKSLVEFPLSREYPLQEVTNGNEFKARFEQIFDANLVSQIVNSDPKNDWSEVGWRGIMLQSGLIWLDTDGKLIAVNYQTNYEKEERLRLIANDKKSIHESIKEFAEPMLVMNTEKFKIRIDEMSNGKFRYTSWSANNSMADKPDLILKNGEWFRDGTGGNNHYEFVNKNYKYVCAINIIAESGTPPMDLTVYKDDEQILYQGSVGKSISKKKEILEIPERGVLIPIFDTMMYSNEFCCVLSPETGFIVYDEPKGKEIGKLKMNKSNNLNDQSAYEIYLVSGKKKTKLEDYIEIGYEIMAITYSVSKSGFVKIMDSTKNAWLNIYEIEKQGFVPVSWLDFLIHKSEDSTTFYVNEPGLRIRKEPNTESEILGSARGDLNYILLTKEISGQWCKVKVTKYREHPMSTDLTEMENTESETEGWIKIIDDNGEPNIWFFVRGC